MPLPVHQKVSQTASQTKSLHLLRALLREASYLPDAAARDYFRRYVVARFKAYQPTHNATASFDVRAVDKYRHRSFKRRHIAIINDRTAQQHRKAQKGLNFLRRANQGEEPCLEKVLWFTYGRLGRRKYALLDDLLKPDPAWPDASAPMQQLYNSNARCLQYFEKPKSSTAHIFHISWISKRYPRLRAVLASQVHNNLSLHRSLKRPYLKTPSVNVWMRPMPLKRSVNIVRHWYAETMTRLLPALPVDEWDAIRAMSTAQQPISFAKRRTPIAESSPQPRSDHHRFEHMLHRHLAMDKLSRADKPVGVNRPHAVTARFMQRLYARLLVLSCKLEYDPTRKEWKAIWGEPTKNARPASYTAPVNDSLFAGVDDAGQVPRAPKKDKKLPPKVQPRNEEGDYMRFPFFAEMLPATHPLRMELDEWKRKRADVHAKWLASGGDV
jgi:hypothetical protein